MGVYSGSGTATIGSVSGRFGGADGDGNTVTIGTYLHGGGLVGTYSQNTLSNTVGAVTGASFVENQVTVGSETATDDVFGHGGVLGFAGLAKPLTIENSRFEKNSLVVNNGNSKAPQDMAAAVFVDTARTGLDAGVTAHTVVLRADAGKELVFSENSQTVGGVTSKNAILFGRDRSIPDPSQTLDSLENAALDVQAAADGTILLEDAVLVDMNNGKSFAMTVANAAGSTFRWGGDNRWRVDAGGTARLDLENANGRTEFLDDFVLRPENGTVLDLSVAAGHTLAVGIGERTATQALFALNDAGAASTVAIGSGARIEPTVNGVQSVRSLELADRYLIVTGTGADDFLGLLVGSSRLAEFGPLVSDASGVWLPVTGVVDPASFYNSSPNAVALAPLVDAVLAGHDVDMTEDEYVAFLTSLPDLAPENVLAMPHFALAATDRFRDTALRQSRLPLIRRPGDMARAALAAGGRRPRQPSGVRLPRPDGPDRPVRRAVLGRVCPRPGTPVRTRRLPGVQAVHGRRLYRLQPLLPERLGGGRLRRHFEGGRHGPVRGAVG
ncbi:MAG: hypothetical protein LUG50_08995, partial [Planctomycetaceae bacterium]|nr:hypothetical protein [Planctomycetaceae bacterium]